jgi:hypothetical protein
MAALYDPALGGVKGVTDYDPHAQGRFGAPGSKVIAPNGAPVGSKASRVVAGGAGAPTAGGSTLPYGYTNNIQANPYLDKAFKYFEELWGKSKDLEGETYNKEPAIQDYERMRSQGMKEQQAGAGAKGFGPGTGMSLSQMQQYGQGTEQGAQGLAGNLWNQGLTQRTALLNNMGNILQGLGGVGNNIAGNELGTGQLGLGYATLGSNTALKLQELALEQERANREAQLEAFRYSAPYLLQTA